jgi:hypothetical protein
MASFLARRLLQSALTLLGVLTATFFLVRLAGDPTTLLLPVEATTDEVANFRTALGLDQPLLVQYMKFVAHAVEGDFGISLRQRTPALELVLGRRRPETMGGPNQTFLDRIGAGNEANWNCRCRSLGGERGGSEARGNHGHPCGWLAQRPVPAVDHIAPPPNDSRS